MSRRRVKLKHLLLLFGLTVGFGGCCPKPLVMPDGGYRADIHVLDPPNQMLRGEQRQLVVRLKNASPYSWATSGVDTSDRWRGNDDDRYRINLADHWIAAQASDDVHDDARSRLQDIVEPDETITVTLSVTAPEKAGEYILEIDLVQENVAWFALKGSRTAQYPVSVR